MKENIKATNFDHKKYAVPVQSTKIGTLENNVINSMLYMVNMLIHCISTEQRRTKFLELFVHV